MADHLALHPGRTALLVMDYQTGLVGRLPDADALLSRVTAAIADVRDHGGHVGWVRVAFDQADLDAIPPSSVMAGLVTPERRPSMLSDSPATQIHARLDVRPGDALVRKVRVGAFTRTDLGRQLAERGVDTLVLAGISTSGVVLSTVREAMDRDYRIVVLHDACADPEADNHTFLTEKLFPRHATVIDVAGLRRAWA